MEPIDYYTLRIVIFYIIYMIALHLYGPNTIRKRREYFIYGTMIYVFLLALVWMTMGDLSDKVVGATFVLFDGLVIIFCVISKYQEIYYPQQTPIQMNSQKDDEFLSRSEASQM